MRQELGAGAGGGGRVYCRSRIPRRSHRWTTADAAYRRRDRRASRGHPPHRQHHIWEKESALNEPDIGASAAPHAPRPAAHAARVGRRHAGSGWSTSSGWPSWQPAGPSRWECPTRSGTAGFARSGCTMRCGTRRRRSWPSGPPARPGPPELWHGPASAAHAKAAGRDRPGRARRGAVSLVGPRRVGHGGADPLLRRLPRSGAPLRPRAPAPSWPSVCRKTRVACSAKSPAPDSSIIVKTGWPILDPTVRFWNSLVAAGSGSR